MRFVGDFYAQWEWKVTNLKYVSVPFLQHMIRAETPEGWTESACHPGCVDDDCPWVYGKEREAEIRTLTDPAIRETIQALEIELRSYAGYPSAAALAAR